MKTVKKPANDTRPLREKLRDLPGDARWFIAVTFVNRGIFTFSNSLDLLFWILDNFGVPRDVSTGDFYHELRSMNTTDRLSLNPEPPSPGTTPEEFLTIICYLDLVTGLKYLESKLDLDKYKINEDHQWGKHLDSKLIREWPTGLTNIERPTG